MVGDNPQGVSKNVFSLHLESDTLIGTWGFVSIMNYTFQGSH